MSQLKISKSYPIMRIALDLQEAQVAICNANKSNDLLVLVQEIARRCGVHEVFVVLNGSLTNFIQPIRVAFDGLLPQTNICVWYAFGDMHTKKIMNEK